MRMIVEVSLGVIANTSQFVLRELPLLFIKTQRFFLVKAVGSCVVLSSS